MDPMLTRISLVTPVLITFLLLVTPVAATLALSGVSYTPNPPLVIDGQRR